MKTLLEDTITIELEGILVPDSWTSGNRVKAIAIYAAGEKEYQIDMHNKLGKELKMLLGNRVKIKGLMSPGKNPKHIIVNAYQKIKWKCGARSYWSLL